MRKNIEAAIFLLIAGYLGLILTGVKEYVLWQQVVDYHNGVFDPDPLESGLVRFLHAPRYILTWPVFYVSEKFSFMDMDLVFGVEVFILVVASWLLLCSRNLISKSSFGVLLALVSICILMNGRLVFAIFSASVFVFLDRRIVSEKSIKTKDLLLAGFSFLASTVSSGAILMFAVMSACLFYRHRDLAMKRGCRVVLTGLLLAVTLLLFVAAVKVYVYYGEGLDALQGILTHGLGGQPSHVLLSAIAAAAAWYLMSRFMNSPCGFLYAMALCGISSLLISWAGVAYVIPAVLALINESCTGCKFQNMS